MAEQREPPPANSSLLELYRHKAYHTFPADSDVVQLRALHPVRQADRHQPFVFATLRESSVVHRERPWCNHMDTHEIDVAASDEAVDGARRLRVLFSLVVFKPSADKKLSVNERGEFVLPKHAREVPLANADSTARLSIVAVEDLEVHVTSESSRFQVRPAKTEEIEGFEVRGLKVFERKRSLEENMSDLNLDPEGVEATSETTGSSAAEVYDGPPNEAGVADAAVSELLLLKVMKGMRLAVSAPLEWVEQALWAGTSSNRLFYEAVLREGGDKDRRSNPLSELLRHLRRHATETSRLSEQDLLPATFYTKGSQLSVHLALQNEAASRNDRDHRDHPEHPKTARVLAQTGLDSLCIEMEMRPRQTEPLCPVTGRLELFSRVAAGMLGIRSEERIDSRLRDWLRKWPPPLAHDGLMHRPLDVGSAGVYSISTVEAGAVARETLLAVTAELLERQRAAPEELVERVLPVVDTMAAYLQAVQVRFGIAENNRTVEHPQPFARVRTDEPAFGASLQDSSIATFVLGRIPTLEWIDGKRHEFWANPHTLRRIGLELRNEVRRVRTLARRFRGPTGAGVSSEILLRTAVTDTLERTARRAYFPLGPGETPLTRALQTGLLDLLRVLAARRGRSLSAIGNSSRIWGTEEGRRLGILLNMLQPSTDARMLPLLARDAGAALRSILSTHGLGGSNIDTVRYNDASADTNIAFAEPSFALAPDKCGVSLGIDSIASAALSRAYQGLVEIPEEVVTVTSSAVGHMSTAFWRSQAQAKHPMADARRLREEAASFENMCRRFDAFGGLVWYASVIPLAVLRVEGLVFASRRLSQHASTRKQVRVFKESDRVAPQTPCWTATGGAAVWRETGRYVDAREWTIASAHGRKSDAVFLGMLAVLWRRRESSVRFASSFEDSHSTTEGMPHGSAKQPSLPSTTSNPAQNMFCVLNESEYGGCASDAPGTHRGIVHCDSSGVCPDEEMQRVRTSLGEDADYPDVTRANIAGDIPPRDSDREPDDPDENKPNNVVERLLYDLFRIIHAMKFVARAETMRVANMARAARDMPYSAPENVRLNALPPPWWMTEGFNLRFCYAVENEPWPLFAKVMLLAVAQRTVPDFPVISLQTVVAKEGDIDVSLEDLDLAKAADSFVRELLVPGSAESDKPRTLRHMCRAIARLVSMWNGGEATMGRAKVRELLNLA